MKESPDLALQSGSELRPNSARRADQNGSTGVGGRQREGRKVTEPAKCVGLPPRGTGCYTAVTPERTGICVRWGMAVAHHTQPS
jgi:hypothetical protein